MGNDKRIISSTALGLAITLGDLVLALVVWRVPYWRHFQLIIYCPGVLFLSYLYLLDESVRWLLTRGDKERVKELEIKISGEKMEKVEMKNKAGEGKYGGTEDIELFSVKLLFSSRILLKRYGILIDQFSMRLSP